MFFIAYLIRRNINIDASVTFACGALAGSIAVILTAPADGAKTFRQIELRRNKYSTNQLTRTFLILLQIFRVEGSKGLLTGMLGVFLFLIKF